MWKSVLASGFLYSLITAIPTPQKNESKQQNLPRITLPYGIYQATKYDAVNDVSRISYLEKILTFN